MKKISFFVLFQYLLFFKLSFSQCTDQGPFNSGTVTNNNVIGTLAWSGIGNTTNSDNNYATAGSLIGILATVNSNYLTFKNFSFSVPASAEICGIEVHVERSSTGVLGGSAVRDNAVFIIKNNLISGNNHATASGWPSVDASVNYGGNADKWGLTWTPADINASNFGVAISTRLSAGLAALFLTGRIDRVRMTVYYSIILPVILERFTVTEIAGTAELNWITASEQDNDYFLVQRSGDGFDWITLDSIAGAENGQLKNYYEYTDQYPSPLSHYRLIQIDHSGKQTISYIVTLKMNSDSHSGILVYPNPARGFVYLKPAGDVKQIKIVSPEGKLRPLRLSYTSSNEIKVDLSLFPDGIYILIVEGLLTRQQVRISVKHQ